IVGILAILGWVFQVRVPHRCDATEISLRFRRQKRAPDVITELSAREPGAGAKWYDRITVQLDFNGVLACTVHGCGHFARPAPFNLHRPGIEMVMAPVPVGNLNIDLNSASPLHRAVKNGKTSWKFAF